MKHEDKLQSDSAIIVDIKLVVYLFSDLFIEEPSLRL